MEAFALYLLKSVIWLSGFALVFLLFLRNERFFVLNRLYLVTGILASVFLPFITVHYTVAIPEVRNILTDTTVLKGLESSPVTNNAPYTGLMLLSVYLSGVLFVIFMVIKQSKSVFRSIKKAGDITSHPVKLIRTSDYANSFSFFSHVFVNPSITDLEIKEIINHEMAHIRQWHWFDLVLAEMLCIIQWFNPLVWIYIRFIRQNHEYLADEVALQRTSDPAIYRAALLNQIVGSPVISLGNYFNHSLNKKRFNMMKNIISSPYRKMKLLLILPVIAIVLYAFAVPEYRYENPDGAEKAAIPSLQKQGVKGKVVQRDGKPLQGATLIIAGTTTGTSSDENGKFSLTDFPNDAELVVTFVGYKSKVLKPVFTSDMTIMMEKDTVKILDFDMGTPAPPPPPPPPPPTPSAGVKSAKGLAAPPAAPAEVKSNEAVAEPAEAPEIGEAAAIPASPDPESHHLNIRGLDGQKPLVVLNGVVTDINVAQINPDDILTIDVIKGTSATDLYGEKAKDGVIRILTKKPTGELVPKSTGTSKPDMDVFIVVEEMPEYPGGQAALASWINNNLKYPQDAAKKKITGKVLVDFTVTSSGKVMNVQVNKSVNPLLDSEAKRVISSMPDWKPGTQAGRPVDVQIMVPVEFKL